MRALPNDATIIIINTGFIGKRKDSFCLVSFCTTNLALYYGTLRLIAQVLVLTYES